MIRYSTSGQSDGNRASEASVDLDRVWRLDDGNLSHPSHICQFGGFLSSLKEVNNTK